MNPCYSKEVTDTNSTFVILEETTDHSKIQQFFRTLSSSCEEFIS